MGVVVITGVAGFLGSNLALRLLAEGRAVIGLDNLLTGLPANIEALIKYPKFQFIEHDIRCFLPRVVRESQPSQLYNLACPASPVWYVEHPTLTLETCALGIEQMIQLARATGARLLQASTSEVYGDPAVHPQTEAYLGNVNPYGPRSMYDEGKRYAEARLYVARHHEGVNTAVVRIFNTYGPRMNPKDGRVVTEFIMKILQGQPIELHGDGLQTRSFCYVDDLVDGLIRMMDSTEEGPINLGNPGEFTMVALATLIGELTGLPVTLTHLPARPDDPSKRQPDIRLALERLDWQPTTALRDGLVPTITHFAQVVSPQPARA